MASLKLTDPFIRNYPKPESRTEIYDSHTNGLAIRITPTGHKSFVYRYRFNENVKRFTIGTFPAVTLADARGSVKELFYQISHGIDPLEAKKAKKSKPKPKTFQYLADEFKKKHLPKLKETTQKTYRERIDSEMLPVLKNKYVKDISRSDVVGLLEEIAFERSSPIQSNRVRAILSSMFSFGVQREIAEYNPVKAVKPMGEEVKRDRVLDEIEIRNLWAEFEVLPDPTRSLFKLLIILGQRLGETSLMQWEHLSDSVWTIPKAHTKAKRKHWVPLTDLSLDILDCLENDHKYVFASPVHAGKPINAIQSTWQNVRNRAGLTDVRIHDLRRTAATYMAELGTDRTILGKVLNHKGLAGDSQVTARYDRHSYMKEKRQSLNRWSHKLNHIIADKETKITKIG